MGGRTTVICWLLPNGVPWFTWPPLPETLELTLAEVDRLTRAGATINIFMLDDEPRLFFMRFWANDELAKLAAGLTATLDKIDLARG